MKIISLISGLFITALMILFFTGTIDFNNGINESIINGNRAYAANNYDQALETYQKGLGENSEESRLNYNSGQASYRLNKYEDAVKYYAKASDTPDKYLNSGNSSLKLAESTDDAAQKQQYYQQALETYKEGIIAFPENVPLKYNYEYVKSKLGDQQGDNSEEPNKNGNEENKDNQENNQNGQGENQQNEDSEQNNQNESTEQKDSEENQQSSQDKESNEQDKSQNEEENTGENAPQMEEPDSSNSEQSDNNVAQVLKMLEKQEQESLKNNQEVKSSAKEDEYDW